MAIKGWPQGGTAVAGDGFWRAEICLICLMFVSEASYEKFVSFKGCARRLWGWHAGSSMSARERARQGNGRRRDVKIQDKRVRMLGNRGLPVWVSIDSPAVFGAGRTRLPGSSRWPEGRWPESRGRWTDDGGWRTEGASGFCHACSVRRRTGGGASDSVVQGSVCQRAGGMTAGRDT